MENASYIVPPQCHEAQCDAVIIITIITKLFYIGLCNLIFIFATFQIAGIFYRYNILYIQQVPWVPGWLARGASATLARLLASSPPPEAPAGATLELQRQEQIEMWEQQMMMNRAREMRNRPGVSNFAF